MEVINKTRKSAVLTPSDLPCLRNVCSVNVSAGCAHGCTYCYARSYSQAPTEGKVLFYANTAEKLIAEWPRKRKTPDRVYFCPSSDLFQPVPELLDAAYDMMEFILAQGATVALTTKGVIPERHMALLLAHPEQVHVQAGLITHDDAVRMILEPHAAPVTIRVTQAKRLRESGVNVKLRIAPIIPSITDDDATFLGRDNTRRTPQEDRTSKSPTSCRSAPRTGCCRDPFAHYLRGSIVGDKAVADKVIFLACPLQPLYVSRAERTGQARL